MSKPDQIHHVTQMSAYLRALFYGLPGIGKTHLLGTGGKGTLVLDCGTNETDTNAAQGQDVDVWEVHNLTSLDDAYEYCRHEGCREYRWVWIDGLSPLEGRLMKEELLNVVAKSPHRSMYVPDKAEYLKVQSYLDRYVQLFCDLPMHVGFTAHVDMQNMKSFDGDDEMETLTMMPMIQGGRGKLSQKICGHMNIVGYMDFVEREVASENKQVRAMLVTADGRHVAKDRFDVLGTSDGWMLNPTIPKIEAAVKGKLAAAPKKAAAKKTAKKATKTTKKVVKKATQPVGKAAGLRTTK